MFKFWVLTYEGMSSYNKQLRQILDIGNMFGSTYGFKIHYTSNFEEWQFQITSVVLLIFIFLHGINLHHLMRSPDLVQNILSDRLWVPLL